ncbi:MAG: hypothetical protein ACW99Q_24025, partial [Candidatus Kariarchaeaceae archaeon]
EGSISLVNNKTLTCSGMFWSDESDFIQCKTDETLGFYYGGENLKLFDCRFDRIQTQWFDNASDVVVIDWAISCANEGIVKTIYLDKPSDYNFTPSRVRWLPGYDGIRLLGRGRGLTKINKGSSASSTTFWLSSNNLTFENFTAQETEDADNRSVFNGGNDQGGVKNTTIRRLHFINYSRTPMLFRQRSIVGDGDGLHISHLSDFCPTALLSPDNGSHTLGMRGIKDVDLTCVTRFDSRNGYKSGGGWSSGWFIDQNFDPGKLDNSAVINRFCAWGMQLGLFKSSFTKDNLNNAKSTFFWRNGRARFCRDNCFGRLITEAGTNKYHTGCKVYWFFENVWGDGGLHYPESMIIQGDYSIKGRDLTLDQSEPAETIYAWGYWNFMPHGIDISQAYNTKYADYSMVVDIDNLTIVKSPKSGIVFGVNNDAYSQNITLRNLQLHNCVKDEGSSPGTDDPIHMGFVKGNLTVYSGEIENAQNGTDNPWMFYGDADSSSVVEFNNVIFGGTDHSSERGIWKDAGTTRIYDCNFENIDSTKYNLGGTVEVGSKPSFIFGFDSPPGRHLFDIAISGIHDSSINLATDDIEIVLCMTDTTIDTENTDITVTGDFSTLDFHNGNNYAQKDLAESWSDPVFSASDLTWTALGNGSRDIAGALIYKNVVSSADDIPIAWIQFNEMAGGGIHPDGENFKIYWDSAGIFNTGTI